MYAGVQRCTHRCDDRLRLQQQGVAVRASRRAAGSIFIDDSIALGADQVAKLQAEGAELVPACTERTVSHESRESRIYVWSVQM